MKGIYIKSLQVINISTKTKQRKLKRLRLNKYTWPINWLYRKNIWSPKRKNELEIKRKYHSWNLHKELRVTEKTRLQDPKFLFSCFKSLLLPKPTFSTIQCVLFYPFIISMSVVAFETSFIASNVIADSNSMKIGITKKSPP